MSQNKKTVSSSTIGRDSRDQPRQTKRNCFSKLSHSNKAAGFSSFIFLFFLSPFLSSITLICCIPCAVQGTLINGVDWNSKGETTQPFPSFISNEPHGKETRTHNVLRDSQKEEIKLYLLRQKTFFFLFSFFFFFFWRNEIEGV